MICGLLLWLTDVTMDRAPLMYQPGTHRKIAAAMDRDPQYIDNPVGTDRLPELNLPEPRPLLVRQGDVSVLTTSMIHGASSNTGTRDRKVMFINFVPQGVEVRANMDHVEARNAYLSELRRHFRPDRRHILPEPRG
jgi:ectoine hydroxylase-related dioxygenase (phytanoyl-CoA dioxygenase family)